MLVQYCVVHSSKWEQKKRVQVLRELGLSLLFFLLFQTAVEKTEKVLIRGKTPSEKNTCRVP